MPQTSPLFASDRRVARLLDMTVEEFLLLVNNGHLPRGREIAPGMIRWDTESLLRVIRGNFALEEMEW